jgi:hypothetical protein
MQLYSGILTKLYERRRETYPGERTIHKRFNTLVAPHIMTQPDLDNLVLRYGWCNNIEDISQS